MTLIIFITLLTQYNNPNRPRTGCQLFRRLRRRLHPWRLFLVVSSKIAFEQFLVNLLLIVKEEFARKNESVLTRRLQLHWVLCHYHLIWLGHWDVEDFRIKVTRVSSTQHCSAYSIVHHCSIGYFIAVHTLDWDLLRQRLLLSAFMWPPKWPLMDFL